MRVKLTGQALRCFEGAQSDNADGQDLLPYVWATLQRIAAAQIPPDRHKRREGYVLQYARDMESVGNTVPPKAGSRQGPPIKFSRSGKCAVIIGQMVTGDLVRYHRIDLYAK